MPTVSGESEITSSCPMHPWEWSKRPWARIHIDHLGPFQGKIILVVVDAYSKWIESVIVPSTSSQATIKALRNNTHGIPETIVSDNGSEFTSCEFGDFTRKNGIRHIKTAPYHPASNGLAERAVQTIKEGLKKMTLGNLETRLARFLYHYRITPHVTTGVSPAELLMGRKLRSQLDLLQPDTTSHVLDKQTTQKLNHDKHTKERSFEVSDPVLVYNFSNGPKWLSGTIIQIHGNCNYTIELTNGRIV